MSSRKDHREAHIILNEEMYQALKKTKEDTRIPMKYLILEGIELAIKKYSEKV